MDPSYARKYTYFEIEVTAGRILKNQYPQEINIPIDVDLIVERHELIDDIGACRRTSFL